MNKFEQKNTEINEQIKNAASCWTSIDENKSELNNYITDHAIEGLKNLEVSFEPDYKINVAALKIGEAILAKSEELNNRIKKSLDSVNKHIWTPHSLGEIKDYNFKNKSLDERRSLKFCERRNHERMISDRTKLIVSTSTTIARYLWTHYKVPVENTFYFPPCVDEEVFRPYSQQELSDTYEYLSQKSKISVKKLMEGKIIFETSRMDRTKRKDLLIEAFKKTVNDYDDTYLFIGGGPKEELFNELMEQINSCKDLKGRAFLTGPIPDKYIGTIFSAAYIYATASEMEGFGMSASQAAVAGTPIACSDLIPFCNFYISEHSEMFKNGDADDFAKAIKSLLDDKNKRDWFAKEARKKARVLDWENKTKEFLQIIKAKNI